MKYIIRDKNSLKYTELDRYIAKDEDSAIHGLDENIEIFKVIDSIPDYDSNRERLIKDGYIFSNEPHNKHINIAYINYIIKKIPSTQIIDMIDNSLGTHLDSNYPLWERIKHSGEGNYILWNKSENKMTSDEIGRKEKIDNSYAWIKRCRAERDKRVEDFLTNDIFPSFEWEERPNN